MKKIALVIVMILLVGCQKQEVKEFKSEWYMLSKTVKEDLQYSPFLDEMVISDELLDKIQNMQNVEDILPVYSLDTTLIEPGKLDNPYGNIKIYKNDQLISEYFFDPTNENVNSFRIINVWGYPHDLNMNDFTIYKNQNEITDGCYLSYEVAKQLGITNLNGDYLLEIYCLIPVSNQINSTLVEKYPDLVQDVTNDKQLLYPYTLKVKIAGILDPGISSSRGQLYIPLEQMQNLINEHQIEEVKTNNYIVKIKESSALKEIQSLDKDLKIKQYPLESTGNIKKTNLN
ncbi:MAG: hypothetical protein ACLROI_01220 [Beduini sp.]|uniref:hypothetical protein n=1 Tax=Beduini sp. TaxID=1922300 RepID=UPI003990600C